MIGDAHHRRGAGPRIGSLCSGYEGLGMAIQSVIGGELAWVADSDPGAAKILAHHYPGVPNLGDITAVNWADVEPVDIITAGFPLPADLTRRQTSRRSR